MAEAVTPLAGRSADLARLSAVELPFATQVDVRTGDAAALGFPVEPNTWARVGERDALWLGPDEWLIVGAPGDVDGVTADLEASLAGRHHSVVDVSANRAIVSGSVRSRRCDRCAIVRCWRTRNSVTSTSSSDIPSRRAIAPATTAPFSA